jgi:predicted N-acyltransferase
LTLEFFELLVASDSFCDNLCFICARRYNNETATTTVNRKDKRSNSDVETAIADSTFCAEDVFAGTINVIKDGVFYGRYWGCLPGMQIPNLHFEVCYWQSIEYCIRKGLKRAEPGAGGGDYKWARGFDPALVHSVHYICNPLLRRAIRQYVDYETETNIELMDYLKWKRRGKGTPQAATVAPA